MIHINETCMHVKNVEKKRKKKEEEEEKFGVATLISKEYVRTIKGYLYTSIIISFFLVKEFLIMTAYPRRRCRKGRAETTSLMVIVY